MKPHLDPGPRINAICVYCASGEGNNPVFMETARHFGRILAARKIRLVYGGGHVGMMGELANSVIDNGGEVTGIIPRFMVEREGLLGKGEEILVDDMHERKRLMFEKADAFVALQGGIGTLEELIEVLTWKQIGRHFKPITAASIGGFWDPLITLLKHMSRCEMINYNGKFIHLSAVDQVEDVLPDLLRQMAEVGVASITNGKAKEVASHF